MLTVSCLLGEAPETDTFLIYFRAVYRLFHGWGDYLQSSLVCTYQRAIPFVRTISKPRAIRKTGIPGMSIEYTAGKIRPDPTADQRDWKHGILRVGGVCEPLNIFILGVTLNDTLTFDEHVCRTVSQSSQSLYALRVLRAHGLEGAALWDVTRATLVSKMLYASPVWWGSITAAAKQRLQSLLSKLQRIGFLPQQFSTFAELCEQADRSLFSSIIANSAHVLASLLPPIHHTGYDLRKRSHDHIIPRADTILRKQFILRMLYDY